ncbi:hypothetical protein [Crocosphaera watsonii]|uniref:Uncharacterized protein n=2 Tax=Crocosphaera watsonii TaxID=263511 RepID=G5JDS9_CROWT|nr:hypothetical protein [Crocosphaera watsonii]EHJ09659.1 hypothetical protein CWATWH0003_5568 [Crocosphaera watsonii WH 0003]CCQ56672.1 hypothetical protein CWATWH0005_3053 [Crocosphaera watsonii WH 0005]
MPNKRARITDDNDPLSSTDEVLAGFQQLSQSTSQPVEKRESQQPNQQKSQPVEKSESQQVNQSNRNQANLSDSPEHEQSTSQPVALSTGQLEEQLESQEVELSLEQEGEKQSNNQLTRQKVKKLTSEQVDKLKLRKVTFKIQESVVNRLDRLHLQLQLDLGKANAPYKEVIVEEAISLLLEEMESNRDELIEVLQERQSQRK